MHVHHSFSPAFCAIVAAACLSGLMASAPAQAASGSVKCPNGKTYTASTPGGSCKVGDNWASCTGSNGKDKADVWCKGSPNPCTSSGEGSCKSEIKGGDGTTVKGGLKLPHGMIGKPPAMMKQAN